MILFLTYHRIAPRDQTGDTDFYTVGEAELAAQVQMVREAGFQPLNLTQAPTTWTAATHHFALSFDDGTTDHFDCVYPLLERHGLQGVFFIPSARLNRPGYVNPAQVQELARAGHTIGLHSHDHRRLDLLSDDDLREQLGRSRQIFGDLLGRAPNQFAPVGGFINEHVREVALGFGAEAIRTMRWGYNDELNLADLDTIPVNRHTTPAKFQRILQRKQSRYLYVGKQLVKRLVPSRLYEGLRHALFHAGRRH